MTSEQLPRRGPSLAERSAASGIGDPAARRPAVVDPARHCWVQAAEPWPGRWPGLLVEWRRDSAGDWQGRAVFAVPGVGGTQLVECWVEAGRLTPVREVP